MKNILLTAVVMVLVHMIIIRKEGPLHQPVADFIDALFKGISTYTPRVG